MSINRVCNTPKKSNIAVGIFAKIVFRLTHAPSDHVNDISNQGGIHNSALREAMNDVYEARVCRGKDTNT